MTMTYAELKTAIQDYVEDDETTFNANLPIFIRLAEERILKTVQLSIFRKNSTGTMTASDKYLAVPSDYLAPHALSITDGSGVTSFLSMKDPSFIPLYSPDPTVTGTPKYYAVYDVDYFVVAPTPDSNYTVELQYFYRPASLTAGAESGTTWLSENAEQCLLHGALVEASLFLKSEQDDIQFYMKRFNESLSGLKMLGEAKEPTNDYRAGKVIRGKQ